MEASRLARIANANEFPLLAYLIDMVVLEAWREASEAEIDGRSSDAPVEAPTEPTSRAQRSDTRWPGVTLDPAGKVELEQDDVHDPRRQPGEADDLVDLDRRRPERLENASDARCPPARRPARRDAAR